jgi:superfamily II DNA or RNA helicase
LPIYLTEEGSQATVTLDSNDSEHSAIIQQFQQAESDWSVVSNALSKKL